MAPTTPMPMTTTTPTRPTTVSIIGSTGSIGTQAIEVIESCPERFTVVALGAQTSIKVLADQARRFHPSVVAVGDGSLAPELARMLPPGIEVVTGSDGLAHIATLADVTVNGVVGFAGLTVTLAALEAGRRLCLANKESIIAGAPVVRRARRTPGAEIVPVDSEHCAIHQCLRTGRPDEVKRLLITASGGPFRGRSRDELAEVEVAEALSHPTWSMGPKITVDSSTLMNKGLEVIEAHELFGIPFDAIDVVVHPQSIIHSMVEFTDGAVVAQLSLPDMRLPIGYALMHPDRLAVPFGAIDWTTLNRLDFEEPDRSVFTCLDLAYRAGREGDLAPAWLNAANEVAVAAFLGGRIGWSAIAEVVAETLDGYLPPAAQPGERDADGSPIRTVDDVLETDAAARHIAERVVTRRELAA
ncbi:MAG TPA: 1-deoxy-D-xylulose-5-phosphate reductoisomerase [Acidimicrobiales bacterium]|nr:1-deoxy-D-xylulose-5-phosphate reductoisomerase [Acidimicrobiales bacterium]